LGRAGEAAAGIVKNTERIESATGTAKYRVPDGLDSAAQEVQEVKNTAVQALTSQVRDDLAHADKQGPNWVVRLIVRPTTRFTRPLQALVDAGKVVRDPRLPG
jgi:hypothetical protein